MLGLKARGFWIGLLAMRISSPTEAAKKKVRNTSDCNRNQRKIGSGGYFEYDSTKNIASRPTLGKELLQTKTRHNGNPHQRQRQAAQPNSPPAHRRKTPDQKNHDRQRKPDPNTMH